MERRKKRWTAFAACSLLLAVLAGCGSAQNIVFDNNTEEHEPEIRLTMFGYKYEALNVAAIEDTLHSYMDAYPGVSISYDGIKGTEYFSVLEKRIATGNGDDIFMVDHERVLELGRQGKLADLSGLSTLDDFSDLAKSQMYADGTVDYVPTSISAFGLYCNTDLLKAHHQKVPENLEELETVCDYFVSEGITPIVANNDISLKTVAIARALFPIYREGDAAERIGAFNDGSSDLAEALRPGFALVEQMVKRGWVDPGTALNTEKTKDDLEQFAEGGQPFMLTGAWAVTRLRDLQPAFAFEVRPYPIFEDGSVLVINVDTRVSVNADSPHLEEAKQFVEYMTHKDVMWEFVESQSSFSPLKENRLAGDRAIQSIGPYLTNGRSVLGSDDNLKYPIWDITRQCIVGMLEGDGTQAAVSQMRGLLSAWKSAEIEGNIQ